MRRRDRDGRNKDRGIGAGNSQLEDSQRDVEQDVQHMPRHWQSEGGRGQVSGQPPPPPDDREIARGNQYGRAGEVASKQVHSDLTEHGDEPAAQHRDNRQLSKRPGERSEDIPTPRPEDPAIDPTRKP